MNPHRLSDATFHIPAQSSPENQKRLWFNSRFCMGWSGFLERRYSGRIFDSKKSERLSRGSRRTNEGSQNKGGNESQHGVESQLIPEPLRHGEKVTGLGGCPCPLYLVRTRLRGNPP